MAIKVRKVDSFGKVTREGTTLNDELFEQINWRDETSVEYVSLATEALPNQKANITQIVTKNNGEVWILPPLNKGSSFKVTNNSSQSIANMQMGSGDPGSSFRGALPASLFTTHDRWIAQNAEESSGISFNGDRIIMWSPVDSNALSYYDEDSASTTPLFHFANTGRLFKGNASALYSDNIKTLNGQSLVGTGNIEISLPQTTINGLAVYSKTFYTNSSTNYRIQIQYYDQSSGYEEDLFKNLSSNDVLLIQVYTNASTSSTSGLNCSTFMVTLGELKSGKIFAQETSSSNPTISSITIDGGASIYTTQSVDDSQEDYRYYTYLNIFGRNTSSIPKGIKIMVYPGTMLKNF